MTYTQDCIIQQHGECHMAKRIRLIDEPELTETVEANLEGLSNSQSVKLLEYAEAIDWKLWQILKILEKETEK